MVARIRKNDKVIVLSGKDKGKKSDVLEVLAKDEMVRVKDVALATVHQKASKSNQQPGIRKIEMPIALSKVMPICKSCNQPCRVSMKITSENNEKVRICGKCKEAF